MMMLPLAGGINAAMRNATRREIEKSKDGEHDFRDKCDD